MGRQFLILVFALRRHRYLSCTRPLAARTGISHHINNGNFNSFNKK